MKKHFFTLVELLVVIGIIAVLAGLLLGGVTLARSSARATECQHNQDQTMKLVVQAMNANRDFLVSGNDFSDKPDISTSDGIKVMAPAWTRYLYGGGKDNRDSSHLNGKQPLIADMAVLRCPTFKYDDNNQALGALPETNSDGPSRVKSLAAAYGMVYRTKAASKSGAKFAGFDFRGTKFLKYGSGSSAYAVSPNQLLLGGCATKSAPYDTAGALLYKGSWENKLVKAHGDKCNVFFLDGHTEGLALSELEKKYIPKSTNNDKDDNDETVKFTSAGWLDPDN